MAGYSIFAHSRAIALRGFCLFIKIFFLEYRQKKPLKYYILPFIAVYRFMVNLITKKEMLPFGTVSCHCSFLSFIILHANEKKGISHRCRKCWCHYGAVYCAIRNC